MVINPSAVIQPEGVYYPHRERPFANFFERFFSKLWNRFVEPSNFGLYPKGYNKNVHGPYVPWRYYGKPDTPLKDVKLGEFMAWFRRRNKTPTGFMHAFTRNWWYWAHQFGNARYPNMAYVWQVCLASSVVWYILRYKSLHSIHTTARYH